MFRQAEEVRQAQEAAQQVQVTLARNEQLAEDLARARASLASLQVCSVHLPYCLWLPFLCRGLSVCRVACDCLSSAAVR
jgi:hypothetical protein